MNRLIKAHSVNTVWVNRLEDGEGQIKDLAEFRELGPDVNVRQMKRTVKPISGRIAREQLLKKGDLDESGYGQAEKLAARIRKLTGRHDAPADVEK